MNKIEKFLLFFLVLFFLIPQSIQGKKEGYLGVMFRYIFNDHYAGRTRIDVDHTPGFGVYYEYIPDPRFNVRLTASYQYYQYYVLDAYIYNPYIYEWDVRENVFALELSTGLNLRLFAQVRFFLSPGLGILYGFYKTDYTTYDSLSPPIITNQSHYKGDNFRVFWGFKSGLSVRFYNHFELVFYYNADGILRYVLPSYSETMGSLNLGFNVLIK